MAITEKDFLEEPIHLALRNLKRVSPIDSQENVEDVYTRYLQGQDHEVKELFYSNNLAEFYLKRYKNCPNYLIEYQVPFADNENKFQTLVDIVGYNPDSGTYDLYLLTSSLFERPKPEEPENIKFKREHILEIGFQLLLAQEQNQNGIKFETVNLITLNSDYSRGDNLDLSQLFTIHNVNAEVEKRKEEILKTRELAYLASISNHPEDFDPCTKRKNCPHPDKCHQDFDPNSPSIYNIPDMKKDKLKKLRKMGIYSIHAIPKDYSFSQKQQPYVTAMQTGEIYIDWEKIKEEKSEWEYPIIMIDYETLGLAIPMYPGYFSWEHMVFQFSAHKILSPNQEDNDIEHREYLVTEQGDPSLQILEAMSRMKDWIGEEGTIFAWNKAFEMSKNTEMARRYPRYAPMLENINKRIIDLAEFFKKGYYIHPGFLGGWSIKRMGLFLNQYGLDLEVGYPELAIQKGDQAMFEWYRMVYGNLSSQEKSQVSQNLRTYCGLDTWMMVKIWRGLVGL